MHGARGGGGVEAVWELEDPYGGAAGCGSGEAALGDLRGQKWENSRERGRMFK